MRIEIDAKRTLRMARQREESRKERGAERRGEHELVERQPGEHRLGRGPGEPGVQESVPVDGIPARAFVVVRARGQVMVGVEQGGEKKRGVDAM